MDLKTRIFIFGTQRLRGSEFFFIFAFWGAGCDNYGKLPAGCYKTALFVTTTSDEILEKSWNGLKIKPKRSGNHSRTFFLCVCLHSSLMVSAGQKKAGLAARFSLCERVSVWIIPSPGVLGLQRLSNRAVL